MNHIDNNTFSKIEKAIVDKIFKRDYAKISYKSGKNPDLDEFSNLLSIVQNKMRAYAFFNNPDIEKVKSYGETLFKELSINDLVLHAISLNAKAYDRLLNKYDMNPDLSHANEAIAQQNIKMLTHILDSGLEAHSEMLINSITNKTIDIQKMLVERGVDSLSIELPLHSEQLSYIQKYQISLELQEKLKKSLPDKSGSTKKKI